MPPTKVAKRCVFHVIGYEPLPPERIHRRFERGLEHFRRTWDVAATQTPAEQGATVATWRIDTVAKDWRVETDVVLLDWSDIVTADFAQPQWRIVLRGLAAILDFLGSRAALGYLRTNWRYLLFFLYPVVLLALFALAGYLVARVAIAMGIPWPGLLGPVLGIGCFLALVRWCGRRFYLDFVLCDWRFAADLVRRRRRDLDARLDALADEFAARVQRFEGDEIIVISHSFGAVLMMLILARALRRSPPLADGKRIGLVTAGSSLLKIGLHPASDELREAVRTVIAEPSISWAEYQALVDPVNFYKTDPVAEMGLPACGKPKVRIVRIRDMLTPASYRGMRGNFFRLHRQFVMGNERRYVYDFFMLCCGPLRLDAWVEQPVESLARFGEPGVSHSPRAPMTDTAADTAAAADRRHP